MRSRLSWITYNSDNGIRSTLSESCKAMAYPAGRTPRLRLVSSGPTARPEFAQSHPGDTSASNGHRACGTRPSCDREVVDICSATLQRALAPPIVTVGGSNMCSITHASVRLSRQPSASPFCQFVSKTAVRSYVGAQSMSRLRPLV
jgi:hypothetical protein